MIKIWFNKNGGEHSRWCVQKDDGEIHTVASIFIHCPSETEFDGQFGRITTYGDELVIRDGRAIISEL